jgi:hypothetical protein
MAAYPVLIPLYYAHYHVDVPALRTYLDLTMVMEASSKEVDFTCYHIYTSAKAYTGAHLFTQVWPKPSRAHAECRNKFVAPLRT